MEIYPVLILMAGIVAMDTTPGPQILISEPVVSCTALGLLFGNPEMGLMLGIFFQFLWLGYLPLGAVQFTDNNMAAFIATASLFNAFRLYGFESIHQNAAIIPAMLYSVLIGVIGLHLRNFQRRLNGIRSDKLKARLKKGENLTVKWSLFAGVGTAFIKGSLMALLFIPVGVMLCGTVRYMPPTLLEGMSYASMIIWGAVSASAILFFYTKGRPRLL